MVICENLSISKDKDKGGALMARIAGVDLPRDKRVP